MIGYGLISTGSYFYLRAENRKLKFQVEDSFIANRSIFQWTFSPYSDHWSTETASKNPDWRSSF